MGTIFKYFALAILCSTVSAPQGGKEIWEDAKSYVTRLCTKFARKFETIKVNNAHGILRTQFSVITLNEIDVNKVNSGITSDEDKQKKESYIQGSNWVASYIGISYKRHGKEVHLEDLLLQKLPTILEAFVWEENKLPHDIYLYTYLIPCSECIDIIVEAVKNKIPNMIDDYIKKKYILKQPAYKQLKTMRFWVHWSNSKGSGNQQSDYKQTIQSFKKFREAQRNSRGPKFHYGDITKETLNPKACKISKS